MAFVLQGKRQRTPKKGWFLESPKVMKSVIRVQPVNDRIILLRVNAKPQPITMIQVYMPTTDGSDEAVLEVYADLQKLIEECLRKDRLIAMGDLNAQTGRSAIHVACGKFGYGTANERPVVFGLACR